MTNPKKNIWTDKFFIAEYLRLGSVDRVFRSHKFNLPISTPTYHRLISAWSGVGLVKTAGPNSNLSEILLILSRLLDTQLPLETFFKKHVPASLKPTLSTTHRVVRKIKEGVFRRLGTALIITTKNDHKNILVGQDISLANTHFGHKGDLSLPMGYSKHKETPQASIKRILEREVFTNKIINQTLSLSTLIPQNIKHFMTINIADVSVKVYRLKLPAKLLKSNQLSSFKLKNLRLLDMTQLTNLKPLSKGIRPGMVEIVKHYEKHLDPSFNTNSNYTTNCQLNQQLAYIFSN
jgi:hypothetical protein